MKYSDINIEQVIELNRQGLSQKEIAKQIGCRYQDIQRAIKYNNISLVWKRKQKIKKDIDFFKNIDSEIKAYLLGFFYADGNIDKSLGRISICIQEDDVYILNLFKEYIAPTSIIKKIHNTKGAKNRKPQIMLRINSKEFVSHLLNLGLCPSKTYESLQFPNIPKTLYPHFIRGYFDGDGTVQVHKMKNGYEYSKVGICINWKLFLDKLCEILYDQSISHISISYIIGKTANFYKLRINSAKNTSIFANYIYENSNFFLPRKKNKFNFKIPR